MKRLRLVQVVLQPVFLVDDGETLEPIQVAPLTVTATEWPNIVAHFAEAVAQLREQVEDRETAPDEPSSNGHVEPAHA